jgi:outer membrane protein TolC
MLVSIHKQLLTTLLFFLVGVSVNAQVISLQQCLDSAKAHNRMLQVARNNTLIGTEKHKEATANLIPKININADYKYFFDLPTQLMPLSTFNPNAPVGQFKEAQFGVPHNIGANVQLTMPLYNPQIYGAIQTTKVAQELSQLQYQKSEEQVYVEISNLYYNAQIINKQLEFVDSNITNSERLLKNMKLLKEQQMAKGSDVGKIELQLAQLQTQKLTANGKLLQLLNALKFNMGMDLSKYIDVDRTISLIQETTYNTNNPIDVTIANTQQKLALTELQNSKRSRLPSLSLIGSYGTTGFGYDTKPNDFLKFFPVNFAGVQLSYPIFAGTVTLRKINQKKLELKNSEIQKSIATEQNNIQIQNATIQKDIAKQSITTTQLQISQAQTIYNQVLLQQKQGLATLTDVLLADTALREAQQNYVTAMVDYLKADLELKKATGNILINK